MIKLFLQKMGLVLSLALVMAAWCCGRASAQAPLPVQCVSSAGVIGTCTIAASGNLPTYMQAVASGGVTVGAGNSLLNAATSAISANLKSSGGNVYGYVASNSAATAAYCRFFNLGIAPTVGTSTPYLTFTVPATSTVNFSTDVGLSFGTGISVDCTAGSMAISDTTTITTAASVALTVFLK